jgi:hypothetical protein
LKFRSRRQIDRRGIEPHVYGLDRARSRDHQQRGDERECNRCQTAIQNQNKTPGRDSASQPAAPAVPTVKICKQSHPAAFLSPTLRRFRGF